MDVLRSAGVSLVPLYGFVGLNVLDARLTSWAISLGSREANPLAIGFGSSMVLKALIALCIAIVLIKVGRCHLLKPLCVGMCLIVAWNTLAVVSWM
ncbi:MAG: hypothetical protein JW846_01280 [Dehalococcoidia bacterium]|nr:hypothetical protein [Dehalococcoidia bacterium]